ncbi:MAG: hypothetical protein LBE08_06100, partial [Bifidobacteriaceae bacterium]|nr:hypothetical protein [Bifidobacteriaceae bacterium]
MGTRSTGGRPANRRQHGSGSIRRLPSGRFQALYIGPDRVRRPGPHTYSTRQDAEGWLAQTMRDIELGVWDPNPP